MFPVNFGWNWTSGSWEEDFLSISLYITMQKFKPLGGTKHDPRDFIWTNLNLLVPRMLYAKYQCILASGSWEEYFWRFIKMFLILPLTVPQKGPAPLFEQIWFPISQACFLSSLVEIGRVVLEKKSFERKSCCRTDAAPWHKLSWPLTRWANNGNRLYKIYKINQHNKFLPTEGREIG